MRITHISVKYDDKTTDDISVAYKFNDYSDIARVLELFLIEFENEGIERIQGFEVSL